jgi:hypothetical protein
MSKENIDIDWLQYIGSTFQEGLKIRDNKYGRKQYLKDRAKWIERLGLNPNNPEDWQKDQSELSELERQQISIQATGHPDTDRNTALSYMETQDIIRELEHIVRNK